jgi:hypothetical protein
LGQEEIEALCDIDRILIYSVNGEKVGEAPGQGLDVFRSGE